MKVTVNGRDLNERVNELAKREQQYFEVIKTTGYIVVGTIVFVCMSVLLHYVTGGLVDLGPDRIVNAFKSLG